MNLNSAKSFYMIVFNSVILGVMISLDLYHNHENPDFSYLVLFPLLFRNIFSSCFFLPRYYSVPHLPFLTSSCEFIPLYSHFLIIYSLSSDTLHILYQNALLWCHQTKKRSSNMFQFQLRNIFRINII